MTLSILPTHVNITTHSPYFVIDFSVKGGGLTSFMGPNLQS